MEQTGTCMTELAHSCIRALKQKYPHWSSSRIARFIGMGRSTFNRLENREGKPGLDSIMRLLSSSGMARKISDIPGMMDNKGMAEGVAQNLSHNSDSAIVDEKLAGYFSSRGHRMVLLLATANGEGIARESLKDEYGSEGMRMVDELVDRNILTEEDGILKCDGYAGTKDEPQTLEQETLKDLLLDCVREKYDPGKFGGDDNWLSNPDRIGQ